MIRKLLPHAAIILSVMYVVFYHIEQVNSAMAFIYNDITMALLYALSLVSILNAVFLISDNRKKQKKQYARTKEKRRRQK